MNDFFDVIYNHILQFKVSLKTGATYSDWNHDFKKEFENEVADYEASFNTYVWYAAYGSNICELRFMIYINRCTNKDTPLENRVYTFSNDIYFASKSKLWIKKGLHS